MGPLDGIRILELASIGAGPFAGMMLSDMGAEVLRIDRVGSAPAETKAAPADLLGRGRRSVGVDLKHPDGAAVVLRLVAEADALLEGYRPGVMERLGLGPDVCLQRNPRLVYGRITGWGQDGPLASAAGHDINFISLAGALEPIGRQGGSPVPPLNLVGDFGGGGMVLAFGIVCALLERGRSERGQVVDAAMVDGSAALMTLIHGMRVAGLWSDERGTNLLDTGAHFYDVYETSDGKWVSIGSIEPQFYAELIERLELDPEEFADQLDRSKWPELKKRLQDRFKTKTRNEWCAVLEGTDVCFSPVLSPAEAPEHPHNRQRGTFVEVDGVLQPAPAPRFSRTPAEIRRPAPQPGQHTREALVDWGFAGEEVAALRDANVVS